MKYLKIFILLSLININNDLNSGPDNALNKDKSVIINNINLNINGIEFSKLMNSFIRSTKQKSAYWLSSNKKILAGVGLITIYAYIINKIIHGKLILQSKTNWASWRHNTNLSDLLSKSPTQICRELHQSILDKYNNNSPNEVITPLVAFYSQLEQELLILRNFYQMGKYLKRFKVKFIFFITDHELELANEKINRLLYLKNLITESIQVSLRN